LEVIFLSFVKSIEYYKQSFTTRNPIIYSSLVTLTSSTELQDLSKHKLNITRILRNQFHILQLILNTKFISPFTAANYSILDLAPRVARFVNDEAVNSANYRSRNAASYCNCNNFKRLPKQYSLYDRPKTLKSQQYTFPEQL
jgi:hypothetical protein